MLIQLRQAVPQFFQIFRRQARGTLFNVFSDGVDTFLSRGTAPRNAAKEVQRTISRFHNGGVLEWWSRGVVEWRSRGVVESWGRGVAESWSGGVVESWSRGVVEWWSRGVVMKGDGGPEWAPFDLCVLALASLCPEGAIAFSPGF